jgi:hypothetical protein
MPARSLFGLMCCATDIAGRNQAHDPWLIYASDGEVVRRSRISAPVRESLRRTDALAHLARDKVHPRESAAKGRMFWDVERPVHEACQGL